MSRRNPLRILADTTYLDVLRLRELVTEGKVRLYRLTAST